MIKTDTHIIAYHGWGLSSDFWHKWESILSDEVRFDASNRGYSGEEKIIRFDNESVSKRILFVHSFGLHWCPHEILSEADHLVIFGGFLNFHPDNEKKKKRSHFFIQQMLSRFVDKPGEVLQKFLKNVFYPAEPDDQFLIDDIDHDKLLADLTMIQHETQSVQILHEIPEITILHGEKDKIVSNEKARKLYHELRYRAQYFELKHAGHALPFTQTEACYKFLKPFIEPEYFVKN